MNTPVGTILELSPGQVYVVLGYSKIYNDHVLVRKLKGSTPLVKFSAIHISVFEKFAYDENYVFSTECQMRIKYLIAQSGSRLTINSYFKIVLRNKNDVNTAYFNSSNDDMGIKELTESLHNKTIGKLQSVVGSINKLSLIIESLKNDRNINK